jgi:hypothetical protein
MAKINQYQQFFLLDNTYVVELNDDAEILWVKETKVLDVPLKGGKRTVSNWRKHDVEEVALLSEGVRETYRILLSAECDTIVPEAEYEVKYKLWGGYYNHRLQKYASHWVYHAQGSISHGERVVIARDGETLINHSKGIGQLYHGLIASQAV